MKTCPKCGGIMIPYKRDDGKIVLRCIRCGYEEEASPEILKRYRVVVKPDKKAKVKTTSKPSEITKEEVKVKEELEQAKEDYYELVLEQMGDYGE